MKQSKTGKIKPILSLGILIIFLTSMAQIILSDEDTTEPQVDDVSLSAEEVNQGGTITVYVSASDDISGIKYVYVAIQSPSESQDDILWTDHQNDEGQYALTFTISEYAETGRWQIWYIRTTDNAGNRGFYSTEDINLGFVVNEAEEDDVVEPEQLPDLSVEKILHIKDVWDNSNDYQIAFKVKNVGRVDITDYTALGTRYLIKSQSGHVKFDQTVGNGFALTKGQAKIEHGGIPKDKVAVGDTVTIEIDTSNRIRELREDNNRLTVTVTEQLLKGQIDKEYEGEWRLDLANFPQMFFNNGEFTGIFVVGDNAPARDIVSITDILAFFQSNAVRTVPPGTEVIVPIPVSASKLASEVLMPLNYNTISVGSPCTNDISGVIMNTDDTNCYDGLHPGEAFIWLFKINNKVHMVVAGYDKEDTRRAAAVVVNHEKYSSAFTGNKVCVYGTSLTDITVKPCAVSMYETVTAEEVGDTEETGVVEYAESADEDKEPREVEVPEGPIEVPLEISMCKDSGCPVDGSCAPVGTRRLETKPQSSSDEPLQEISVYCDLGGKWLEQKDYDKACQNNYECGSNLCIDGVCTSLKGFGETQNILKKILSALTKLLSIFGK